MSIFTPKISYDLFLVIDRPGFPDFPLFTVIKMSYTTLSTQEKPLFQKKFLNKTIFYSVHPFAHIRQHYFSIYWGGPMHGPSPHLKFLGERPPTPPPLPACRLTGYPFMTSTKNRVFDPPPPVHMRPH